MMWHRWAFFLAGVLALLVLAPAMLAMLALEHQPIRQTAPALTVEDLDRARLLLRSNDPRWLRAGQQREVSLSQRDLDLVLHHLAARLQQSVVRSVGVELGDQVAWLRLGVAVPANPFGNVLNLALRVTAREGGLALTGARVGRITVPAWLANALLGIVEARAGHPALFAALREAYGTTSRWAIDQQGARFTFIARPDLAWRLESRGRDLLLPPAERERIALYLRRANALGAVRAPVAKSLVPMLQDLIAMAATRTAEGHDARAENRAAVLALAIHAVGRADLVSRLLGVSAPRGAFGTVTLLGRADLAQHWLVSAALALESDTKTADVIGVFKEVLDSRGGSGFSFADLAADRAGVRFGEAAAADPANWQQRAAGLRIEADLMPAIDALPEGLQEPEFQKRFRARDNQAYAQVLAEIEKRLGRCRFFAKVAS